MAHAGGWRLAADGSRFHLATSDSPLLKRARRGKGVERLPTSRESSDGKGVALAAGGGCLAGPPTWDQELGGGRGWRIAPAGGWRLPAGGWRLAADANFSRGLGGGRCGG
jgi:hypothetical protein